jgi:hypothetical protein
MSFQHGYLLPLCFLPMVLVWSSACASVWWVQEVKVEWILLIAPVCKSRCGAQTISHVHPDSAQCSIWGQEGIHTTIVLHNVSRFC